MSHDSHCHLFAFSLSVIWSDPVPPPFRCRTELPWHSKILPFLPAKKCQCGSPIGSTLQRPPHPCQRRHDGTKPGQSSRRPGTHAPQVTDLTLCRRDRPLITAPLTFFFVLTLPFPLSLVHTIQSVSQSVSQSVLQKPNRTSSATNEFQRYLRWPREFSPTAPARSPELRRRARSPPRLRSSMLSLLAGLRRRFRHGGRLGL
jgi:hypothetical protein